MEGTIPSTRPNTWLEMEKMRIVPKALQPSAHLAKEWAGSLHYLNTCSALQLSQEMRTDEPSRE
jgi:hypothetical protein